MNQKQAVMMSAVMFALSGFAMAQEPAAPPALQEAEAAVAEAAAAEPRTPLMSFFDQAGFGSKLDEFGIRIGGWIEGSVTFSLLDNAGGTNTLNGRAFDFETDDPTLNQIGLAIKRDVDYKKPFDLGFSLESIWGGDGRFTASNGMDFQTGLDPDEQFDITEASVLFQLPIGNGVVVKAGKWITPIGYEYTNPTLNALYSHSFLFGIIPFSHTGVMATYYFDDDTFLGVAIARGWEQSLEDNNDCIEGVFTFGSTLGDNLTYAINGSVGPQQDDNETDWRWILDFWCDYTVSDALSLGLNADYRVDEDGAQDGGDSCVWGVAGYGKYTLNDYLLGVARLEYFNDTNRVDGFDSVIYSATLGVTITPFPNDAIGQFWKLRPEIRYDYASEDIFDGGDADDQMSIGLETYFVF